MANRLNLTKPDEKEVEYILTKEEEEAVLSHSLEQAKKHKAWKLSNMGMAEEQILAKLSEINFDDYIDKKGVLINANNSKHRILWEKSNRDFEKKEEDERIEELTKIWTSNMYFHIMSWHSKNTYGKDLIVNDDTKYLIKVLCFFFGNDARFESELCFDFKKGLLIRGISGLGKTHLINCIKENQLKPIRIFSMIEISEKIKQEGDYAITTPKVIYLDDVGTEEHTVNHYGTKINWFKDFIELYYSKNKPFNRLLLSTNNTFQEIEDKYGFRVRSRIKDMFNVIDVKGIDLRG